MFVDYKAVWKICINKWHGCSFILEIEKQKVHVSIIVYSEYNYTN